MKILMNKHVEGAWGFITESLVNAFKDRGHLVLRYDGDEGNWHKFDPDLYVGCSGHKQAIPVNRRAKIAIHVNPYGPVNINGIDESTENINWVLRQNPDAVFGYGIASDKIFWSYWTERHGIPWVPMPTAGDKLLFNNMQRPRSIDLIYLGGRWTYKAMTIDEYLLPVLRSVQNKKVFGWGGWPEDIESSRLEDSKVNEFMNMGRVGPCMSEKHTQLFGIDIPERAFKLALAGVLAIHDPVPTIKSIMPTIIVATNARDYKDLIIYYIENKEEAAIMSEKQRQDVLTSNTYHHRCATLLSALGFKEESMDMINGINK